MQFNFLQQLCIFLYSFPTVFSERKAHVPRTNTSVESRSVGLVFMDCSVWHMKAVFYIATHKFNESWEHIDAKMSKKPHIRKVTLTKIKQHFIISCANKEVDRLDY